MGWTIQGLNPGGGKIVNRYWGPHSLLCSWYWVFFPGSKDARAWVDHQTYPVLSLKKEYSYTSTPPLGIHGLF